MRITSNILMNDFSGVINNNLEDLSDSFNKLSTEKKFTRASDNPAEAMKAMKSYHNLNDLSQYKENIEESTSWVNNTESTVSVVSSIIQSAQETLTRANNSGSISSDDEKIYAGQLQDMQSELLQTLNSTFGGKYVFGGPTSGNPPFKAGAQADGAANVGKLMYYDYNNSVYVPFSGINTSTKSALEMTSPVDVGLGMKIQSGKVVSGTAFDNSTSAIDMLSFNMGAIGTGDIYDTLGRAAEKLSSGATADVSQELNESQLAHSSLLKTTVSLGEKSSFLTFLSNKNVSDNTNIQEKISQLQDVDFTQAITDYETKSTVYRASLSVGAKIIQPSLIDFLR